MVIAIDMDNTLNAFTAGVISSALRLGVILDNIKKPFTDWHIFKTLYPDPHMQEIMAEKIMNEPGFWLSLAPEPQSYNVLKQLTEIATVAIVTKPWHSYNCIPEKILWVEKNYPFFDTNNIVFTSNKDLVPANYIIEDNPDNYKNLDNRKLIIYDQEYNQNAKCDFRATSWKQIGDYFTRENIQRR
jgi:5'(3')-deoxyribonucleotidase